MKKLIITTALIASAGFGLAACGSATPSSAPAAPPAATQTVTAQATHAPVRPAAPKTTTPAAPAMSAAEQQAVESAQNYLSTGMGFSKSGLFHQLTSSAGEGFTAANAHFAISYLKPDWNAQAVASAKNYLSSGMGFSRSELIQQLTSSAGEGFTEAQAEYAVAKAGL